MKKYLFLVLVFFFNFLQAQHHSSENDSLFLRNKNEIRLDIGQLLVNARLQLTYERFFDKDFSAGVSVMYYGVNDEFNGIFNDSYLEKNIQIEPFARYSISKNLERFFYVEANSSIVDGNYKEIKRLPDGQYAYYDVTKSKFTNFALGVGIGYKFYIKKHFCMDFNFGLSSFVYDKTGQDPLPKLGINLGYRF